MRLLANVCRLFLLWLVVGLTVVSSSRADSWYTLNNPISPSQLTDMPFGFRSFWLQPWRSQLATRPATDLENAMGINFTLYNTDEAAATARLLHDSGIHQARLEISWNHMDYNNPGTLLDPQHWDALLSPLRQYGIRPLILLNGSPGGPAPELSVNLTLTAPAAQGATSVNLDPASAAAVVPGLTGFNINGVAAEVLITSVNSAGVATLSQPLPVALTAGIQPGTTLRYAPFAPPTLPNGSPNPLFEQTLSGWMTYVKGVLSFVRNALGSDNFDIEIWNENQDFLNQAFYYSTLPYPTTNSVNQNMTAVQNAILSSTAAYVDDSANGFPDVQIGDGFADQVPWVSGATVPAGINGIDSHPYMESVTYPGAPEEPGIIPVNALGEQESSGATDAFTPNFRAFMPEFYLTGLKTEQLMDQLSPIQTSVDRVPHGATTHPAGGAPPKLWITEDNLDQTTAQSNGLPASDIQEFQAKAALRFYLSYASEGAQYVNLFATVGGPCCSIIPTAFFQAVDADPSSYPASLGGRRCRRSAG